jgi:hypothetical protein
VHRLGRRSYAVDGREKRLETSRQGRPGARATDRAGTARTEAVDRAQRLAARIREWPRQASWPARQAGDRDFWDNHGGRSDGPAGRRPGRRADRRDCRQQAGARPRAGSGGPGPIAPRTSGRRGRPDDGLGGGTVRANVCGWVKATPDAGAGQGLTRTSRAPVAGRPYLFAMADRSTRLLPASSVGMWAFAHSGRVTSRSLSSSPVAVRPYSTFGGT